MLAQKLRLENELNELRNLLADPKKIRSRYDLYKTLQSKHSHSLELIAEIHQIKENKMVIEKSNCHGENQSGIANIFNSKNE
ncbi:MAG: hypothetical protein CM1200mP3_10330 [Chloroflexota bacterium]|nr:MAG: hypothetical protein CM1200mP3_10330 [Chloroflexota bacterium]